MGWYNYPNINISIMIIRCRDRRVCPSALPFVFFTCTEGWYSTKAVPTATTQNVGESRMSPSTRKLLYTGCSSAMDATERNLKRHVRPLPPSIKNLLTAPNEGTSFHDPIITSSISKEKAEQESIRTQRLLTLMLVSTDTKSSSDPFRERSNLSQFTRSKFTSRVKFAFDDRTAITAADD